MRTPTDQRPRRTLTAECRGVPVHVTEEIHRRPEGGEDAEPSGEPWGGWRTHYAFRAVRSERSGQGASGVPFPISETGYRSDFYHGEPLTQAQIADRLDWIAADSDAARAKSLRYLEARLKRASGTKVDPSDASAIRSRTIALDPTGCAFAGHILTLPDDEAGQEYRQRIVRASLACLGAIEALPAPTTPAAICGGEVSPGAIVERRAKILAWRAPLVAALDERGGGGTLSLFGSGPDLGPLLALAPRLGVLPETDGVAVPTRPTASC